MSKNDCVDALARHFCDSVDEEDFVDAYADGDAYREQDAETAWSVLAELAGLFDGGPE